jgi:signal transduction histidine kinase
VAVEKAQLHADLQALNRELEARVEARTRELAASQEALAEKAEHLRQMLAGERRVEERTRARVAHDLHDGVQQLIVGALFELQAAREAMISKPEVAADRCAAAQRLLRELETEMRAAIHNLRPVALDEHGLTAALRECADAFERSTGILTMLQVSGTPRRLDGDAELVAFRIVQEALNNAESHSHASHVLVRVSFRTDGVTLQVCDDGEGFEVASVGRDPRSHLGLIGMRQRAEGINASFDVRSSPGHGAVVTLILPSQGGSEVR